MAQGRSFITEVNRKKRESKRTLNIIFLQVTHVIYCGASYDRHHQERMRTGEINKVKMYSSIADVVDRRMLATLSVHDLSALLGFLPLAVENLRRLCKENNAKIVITSEWGSTKNLAQTKALFSIVKFGEYIIDQIDGINAESVENWLIRHSDNVNSFVILSDYKSDLSDRFNERSVYCKELFIENSLFDRACKALAEPLNFDKSHPKLLFDAIQSNAHSVTHVVFNRKNMSQLRVGLGGDSEALMKRIFIALEKNTRITHLTLQDCYCDESSDDNIKQLNNSLLQYIAAMLTKGNINLEYLNLAHNNLSNLTELLGALDGHSVHVPHVCFDANPIKIKDQKKLAEWMRNYPRPIRIDLDLSGSGWGVYDVDASIINAIDHNENIHVYTKSSLISAISEPLDTKKLDNLVKSGRIMFTEQYTKKCAMN